MTHNKGLVNFMLLLQCIPMLFGNPLYGRNKPSHNKKTRCPSRILHKSTHMEPAIGPTNTQETWVTVFVHGIMSIQPHLTLQNVMRFIRDDVTHTTYSKTVEYMRLDPYFYLNQAMQEFGLKKIDINDLQPGHATNAIAHIYDDVTKLSEPRTESHYYTFGWSGLLSPTTRYRDSIKLLEDLTNELQEKFWQHNI